MIRRGMLTLVGQAVFSGTTFLSGSIVARASTPEQFGLYSLVLAALAWGFTMQGATVTTPYTFRHRQMPPAEQRKYAGTVLWSQLTFAAFVALVFGIVAAVTHMSASAQTAAFAPVLGVAGAVSAVCLLRECCRQLSFGHEDTTSVVALDVAVSVLQLGGLLGIAHWSTMTAPRAFMVIGIATVGPTAVWLWTHRELFEFRRGTFKVHAHESWRFGKWIIAGVLIHSLAKDTFPWIVTILHGTRAAATLAAAFGIAFLVNPILAASTNLLGPAFARRYALGGMKALDGEVRRYTRWAIVLAAVYGVAMMTCGEWMISLIYGPQYAESGRVAGWLALGIGASVVTLPIGVGLYARHRSDITFRAVCVAAAIAVVVSGPLVSRYAAMGVAIALLLENIGESIAKTWWYRGIVRRELRRPAAVIAGPQTA